MAINPGKQGVLSIRYVWPVNTNAIAKTIYRPCVILEVLRSDDRENQSFKVAPIVAGSFATPIFRYAIPLQGADAELACLIAREQGWSKEEMANLHILASEANLVQRPNSGIAQTTIRGQRPVLVVGEVSDNLYAKVMADRERARSQGYLVEGRMVRDDQQDPRELELSASLTVSKTAERDAAMHEKVLQRIEREAVKEKTDNSRTQATKSDIE